MTLVTMPALSVAVGSVQSAVSLPYGILILDGQLITTGAMWSVSEKNASVMYAAREHTVVIKTQYHDVSML